MKIVDEVFSIRLRRTTMSRIPADEIDIRTAYQYLSMNHHPLDKVGIVSTCVTGKRRSVLFLSYKTSHHVSSSFTYIKEKQLVIDSFSNKHP